MPFNPDYYKKLIQDRAGTDPAFRARLLADPAAELRRMRLIVPDGMVITVAEDAQNQLAIGFPAPPPPAEDGTLTDQELEAVAAGADWTYCPFFTCC